MEYLPTSEPLIIKDNKFISLPLATIGSNVFFGSIGIFLAVISIWIPELNSMGRLVYVHILLFVHLFVARVILMVRIHKRNKRGYFKFDLHTKLQRQIPLELAGLCSTMLLLIADYDPIEIPLKVHFMRGVLGFESLVTLVLSAWYWSKAMKHNALKPDVDSADLGTSSSETQAEMISHYQEKERYMSQKIMELEKSVHSQALAHSPHFLEDSKRDTA
eukprot:TRINITY_DN460279_c0_g1_i1.p1 TRINITY_DN460279_c0_g1~~TRINITY_DN460279_c0_g1_i1.p1  ORF type:complete len:218 (-),score=16.75 TRINITY_DN460279_c0_g1_i1:245-898(-)